MSRSLRMSSAQRAVVALVGSLVFAVGPIAGTAVAAKASGGRHTSGSGTITLQNETAPGTAPSYGQTVTFTVSTTATDKPMVELDCSQRGTLVYQHSAGFYPDYPWPWLQNYPLSSTAWTAGAADCVATLYYSNNKGGFVTVTTLSFPVSA